ncbi:hypothetical protein VOLCADRAFT_104299 [Volvox carteri f. nagariensis]|uniref:Coatomer subunit zeta n=1 Tax=Volvox carteri f. nagariensis TaxID=3068 RepID=D8TSM3_VOLCA|nr:uncharacterized protein VOLCADRAFT_104299 [Volvox carteri f. nagariensis]EFJ49513.1 hypothetical protein VOLCADRAFT_104299 [Volvox carteri f. nagariensis]|eukprot:XP_002949494.1 hypothetical protein VOLCADRAFT_104299 [Volvox carteri f. nagariensis]
MDVGRIHCFLVATRGGDVIYERFFDRFTELEKAEIRAAFSAASSNVRMPPDQEQDFIAPYKLTRFAFVPVADTVFYLLGSGEYDEVGLVEVLRVIIQVLKDVLGKAPSSGLLLEKYAKLALVVDEVINEGLLEAVDKEAIKKGIKGKAAWE